MGMKNLKGFKEVMPSEHENEVRIMDDLSTTIKQIKRIKAELEKEFENDTGQITYQGIQMQKFDDETLLLIIKKLSKTILK